MTRHLLAIAFIVAATALRATSAEVAQMTIDVQSATVARAEIAVQLTPEPKTRVILLALPFVSSGIVSSSRSAVLGFAPSNVGSIIIALISPAVTEFDFICAIDLTRSADFLVHIAQYPDSYRLIVPLPNRALLDEILATGFPVISTFSQTSVRFPPGFVVVDRDQETSLKTQAAIPMSANALGTAHEVRFRPPASAASAIIEPLLQSLGFFICTLLIAIASPGLVPDVYHSRFLAALVLFLAAFLAIRWINAFRSKSWTPVITDSIVAMVCLGVAFTLPLLRKRAEKRLSNKTKTPPTPPPKDDDGPPGSE